MFEKALEFATAAHSGTTRKGSNTPYIEHPKEVAEIVKTMSDNKNLPIAALLHDTVEDTNTTIDEIKSLFGNQVAKLVASDTENKRPELSPEDSWKIRKQETIDFLNNQATLEEKILVVADKLSNIRQLSIDYKKHGDAVWQNFHQKNKSEQAWYYLSILNATKELDHYAAWQELYKLSHEIFN